MSLIGRISGHCLDPLMLAKFNDLEGGKAGGHLSEMGISRLGNLSKILADPR